MKYECLPVRFVKLLFSLFCFPSSQSWFWNYPSHSSEVLLYLIWFLLLFRFGLYLNLKSMLVRVCFSFPMSLLYFCLVCFMNHELVNSRKLQKASWFPYAWIQQNEKQWKFYCMICYIGRFWWQKWTRPQTNIKVSSGNIKVTLRHADYFLNVEVNLQTYF